MTSPSLTPKLEPIYTTPDNETRTVILWVSRHDPLPAQIKALEAKLGAIEIWKLSGVVPSADYVVETAEKLGAKVIVPVLPLSFIVRLAEVAPRKGITVLFAKMEEMHRGSKEEAEKLVREAPDRRTAVEYSGGVWRVWEFKQFEKLIRVEIVTEPW